MKWKNTRLDPDRFSSGLNFSVLAFVAPFFAKRFKYVMVLHHVQQECYPEEMSQACTGEALPSLPPPQAFL